MPSGPPMPPRGHPVAHEPHIPNQLAAAARPAARLGKGPFPCGGRPVNTRPAATAPLAPAAAAAGHPHNPPAIAPSSCPAQRPGALSWATTRSLLPPSDDRHTSRPSLRTPAPQGFQTLRQTSLTVVNGHGFWAGVADCSSTVAGFLRDTRVTRAISTELRRGARGWAP